LQFQLIAGASARFWGGCELECYLMLSYILFDTSVFRAMTIKSKNAYYVLEEIGSQLEAYEPNPSEVKTVFEKGCYRHEIDQLYTQTYILFTRFFDCFPLENNGQVISTLVKVHVVVLALVRPLQKGRLFENFRKMMKSAGHLFLDSHRTSNLRYSSLMQKKPVKARTEFTSGESVRSSAGGQRHGRSHCSQGH
jgi:hypothetical protein